MVPGHIFTAAAAAGGLAAVIIWMAAWRERTAAATAVVAVAAGFALGEWLLAPRPSWPPADVVGRWLLLVMPAAAAVETLAAVRGDHAWPWVLRMVVAALVAPILLQGTIYIADAGGAGSRQWSMTRIGFTYGFAAIGLLTGWTTIMAVADHRQGRAVTFALALIVVAAGLAIVMSGYATGGLVGVPLAAALLGAAVANCRSSDCGALRNAAGFGTVGLFAMVFVGHWFSSLGALPAVLLLVSPLALLVLQLPRLAWRRGWVLTLAAMAAVSIPVAGAILAALGTFADDAQPPAPGNEPTMQDYINFGK